MKTRNWWLICLLAAVALLGLSDFLRNAGAQGAPASKAEAEAEAAPEAGEPEAGAADGGAGRQNGKSQKEETEDKDAGSVAVPSYMPSGHAIIRDKDFWRANPRPPTVSTKQWMTADSR